MTKTNEKTFIPTEREGAQCAEKQTQQHKYTREKNRIL